MVEGIEGKLLRAMADACGVAPLTRWPRAAALPLLLERSARFVADGRGPRLQP